MRSRTLFVSILRTQQVLILNNLMPRHNSVQSTFRFSVSYGALSTIVYRFLDCSWS